MYRISALCATSSVHPALYAVSVRTVGISPRTSFSTVRYLPAVVLQVWDSASSRLRADFHRSTRIASVVQQKSESAIDSLFSTPSRARTADKLIKSQLLYQLSYAPHGINYSRIIPKSQSFFKNIKKDEKTIYTFTLCIFDALCGLMLSGFCR